MVMPLAKPIQWCCTKCHWKHPAVMRSDTLVPKPDCCPKCGSEITSQSVSLVGNILDKFRRF